MESIIESTIKNYVTPERSQILVEAETVLHMVNSFDYQIEMEAILSNIDNYESTDTMSNIENCLQYALKGLINNYSIGLKSLDLTILPLVLRGMFDILEHDDIDKILNVCNESGSPEEKLAEILADIYDKDYTEFLNCFEYVSPSLIQTISETIETKKHNNEELSEVLGQFDVERRSTHESASIFFSKHKPEKLYALINDGWQLGYTIDKYLDEVIDPDNKYAEEIAFEYLGAAFAAFESPQDSILKAPDRLAVYFDDVLFIKSVVTAMQNIITEINQ